MRIKRSSEILIQISPMDLHWTHNIKDLISVLRLMDHRGTKYWTDTTTICIIWKAQEISMLTLLSATGRPKILEMVKCIERPAVVPRVTQRVCRAFTFRTVLTYA